MKSKLLNIYLSIFLGMILLSGLSSCGVEPNPVRDNINGIWKVFVGGEYSRNSKEILMKFLDSAIVYDTDTLLFISKNNNRHILAVSDTTKNIIKSLDYKLTYDNNRIIGHEITKTTKDSVSIYFYAQRIKYLPEIPPDTSTTQTK